jgi:hypothetical protein
MWWKKTGYAISWTKFKDDFLKDSKVSKKRIFTELMRLQQKGNVDDFTREWETLATRVLGLSTECLVQSYITGLKPHIQNELKLHDITNMETTIRKARAIEKKLENHYLQKFDKTYSRGKDSDCRFCGDKWSQGHKCNNQSHSYMKMKDNHDIAISNYDDDEKKERKIIVVNVEKIGF